MKEKRKIKYSSSQTIIGTKSPILNRHLIYEDLSPSIITLISLKLLPLLSGRIYKIFEDLITFVIASYAFILSCQMHLEELSDT